MSSMRTSQSTTFRSRTGSHGARDLISGRNSRRISQLHQNIFHPKLQTMVEQWQMRERPSLETENGMGSLLLESEGVADIVELSKDGEVISVLFPWFLANVRTSLDIKLSEFKHLLFEQIAPMKWAGFSTKPQDYVFRQFNNFGEMEVIFNDDQPLSKLEVHGIFPTLYLFQPDEVNRDKELMGDISHCLGYELEKLEEAIDDELRQFRVSLWSRTKRTCLARGLEGFNHYAFPEEQYLCINERCPQDLNSKVRVPGANLYYQLFWRKRKNEINGVNEKMLKVQIKFDSDYTPETLTERFLYELCKLNVHDADDPLDEGWILQLAGRTTFLTNSTVKLTSYDGVRSELESYRCPGFVVRRTSIVLKDFVRPKPLYEPHYVRAHERKMAMDVLSVSIESSTKNNTNSDKVLTDFRPTASLQQVSLWDLDSNLMIRPVTVTGYEFPPDQDKLYVRVEFTVYVGTLILATKESTKVNTHPKAKWKSEMYTFDLYMKDMPPSACLNIRVWWGKARVANDETEVGWVNVSLTDWRDELRQGQFIFHLWPPEPTANRSRIGENGARIGTNAAVTIEISSYGGRVRMPSQGQYTYLVEHRSTWEEKEDIEGDNFEELIKEPGYKRLTDLVKKHEEGIELTEEEQKHIWSWRKYIQKQEPDLLIPLSELRFVWTNRENFSELYVMLEKWRPPSVAAAFTLLGKRCTDRVIRKFAVEKLNDQLSSTTFHLFILPLIQALKYEPRAQSEVGMMLLTRALCDYRVGHRLFWLLRAEIARLKECTMKGEEFMRISLLMEAYLRGNEEHIKVIIKQVEMVNELTRISTVIKGLPKDAATAKLRDELGSISHKMEHMDSPLDPVYKLGELCVDKAIVLGSAKQPLRLVWKNKNPKSDLHLPTCEMIFKNGDDLRQDMLVLQVLEVMDNIWKGNNIDCCLSPYSVLPMGEMIGIIEVVPNCKTLFEIQMGTGFMNTAARSIDPNFVNKWIRKMSGLEDEKKKDKKALKTAMDTAQFAQATKKYLESVDRFLYSCVGYSVATYIMGIKDRHSDNIMLTEDGKLFHIDFGHILGHGKTKLGIQRDRQAFVITEHFLTVIRNGKTQENQSHELVKFKALCVDAYEVMWESRDLFVSLFTLMLGMELPELSTKADLDHLKV
uniref:Uncharacterized protein n=1 Tax=Caenorhabditis japonica TaxID=281687 RepID=A0A8R1DKS9_CAEJA